MNIQPYLTPHKRGPLLSPSGIPGTYNALAVDCPFVFHHNNSYHMLHVGYDGLGYQTGMAHSADLLHWSSGEVLFPRGASQEKDWEKTGIAGYWILKEHNLHSLPALKKHKGEYWMVYHSYPGTGYEEGPAKIGLAHTSDETLTHWERLPEPILSWEDGTEWESGGLYKACLLEEDGVFYLFYNAKNAAEPWVEQIGLATSTDLLHWQRHVDNPLLPITPNAWDSRFASDPFVVRDSNTWLMFYYGYNSRHAQDGLACSTDLLHWEKHPDPIIPYGQPGTLDATHAHKPSIVCQGGVLYHFYCAVRPIQPGDPAYGLHSENRCITAAIQEG